MALTNAEKQKRWRTRRNTRADALTGTPKEIADSVLHLLGPAQAKKIADALQKRLRNLRPDCPACGGSGFVATEIRTACGADTGLRPMYPCDCGDSAKAWVAGRDARLKTTMQRR